METGFSISSPAWVAVVLVAGALLVAWASYAGAIVPLSRSRRLALSALRALTLLLIVLCLLRPVRIEPPDADSGVVVPVLVDVSRSMGIADADGARRVDAARSLADALGPALAGTARTERWTFGDALVQPGTAALEPTHRRSDLSGALREVRERYRGRRLGGIVVISDGGDTGVQDAAQTLGGETVPVYAIGVGAPRPAFDLEVLDVSAGEMSVADAAVDISVAAVSRGGAEPFDLRLLQNGRPIDLRRVTPTGDGSPVRALFDVAPAREAPTVYAVEIPSAAGEVALENNRRSVLVEPAGRRRQVLMVEGAPGFEHSFIKRALTDDAAFDLDSVVRKGRDARGAPTYFVQAAQARAPRLATGFPQEPVALFEYDALILANVESDSFSRRQLQMIAEFVDRRGGGLIVLGAKTFAHDGFAGTPIEEVLPLRLTGRGDGVVPASAVSGSLLTVVPTADGLVHPVMRIAGADAGLEQRWRSMPRLAGVASLGSLRPGAQALALTNAADGPRPLVAVQRYGQGRSLLFAGEASWRWRMQLPVADRSHELFWRQAVRWVAGSAADRVSVGALPPLMPGERAPVAIDVRDDAFTPVADAAVQIRVTGPDGVVRETAAAIADPASGRYASELRPGEAGMYRVRATAVRAGVELGTAERWVLAGGADAEMADPRLNDAVLRRMAAATGGRYVDGADPQLVPALVDSLAAAPAPPRVRELWNTVPIFLAVLLLLGAEWTLRRRWGLR